jgi:hypothetical protein
MNPLAQTLEIPESTGRLNSRQQQLERLPKDVLVDLLLQVEGEWSETTLKFRTPTISRSFNLDVPWKADEFLILPADYAGDGSCGVWAGWRIILVSFDLSHPIVGLEVCGEVMIGRASSDTRPDFDLSAFNADEHGVSREHALLRPDEQGLWLVDLDSTNGTFNNDVRVKPHQSQAVTDKDIIAFGHLKFLVRLEHNPR